MMQRRTLALALLGLLVTCFVLADHSYAYVRYYRLQRELYRPPRTEQVEQFIAALRAGNTQKFRYVKYELLVGEAGNFKGVMETMVDRAAEQNKNFIDWLTDDRNSVVRAKVVRATIAGLRNLDPSVRLTAINLLRRLLPDSTMQMAVKQALARETVASQWEYWRERNIDIPSAENPWLEAFFWDEDETFGYANQAPYVRRFYGDRAQSGEFWANQAGPARVTNGFNGNHSFEDTSHIRSNTPVTEGSMSWADQDPTAGWTGAAVPSGGSWYRPADDIWRYLGDYSLKYACLKYNMQANVFEEVIANPWAEIYKLDLFITRAVWYNKIKAGQLNSMVIISKDTFKSLYMSIDGEGPENIPFPSTASRRTMLDGGDIDVLIQGLLRNKVVTNRWVMARALKYIYKMLSTTEVQKIKIIKAIRRAKYQENRIDIYRGDELYNELVGETTSGVVSRGKLGFPLGFNPYQNDEIDSPDTPINIMDRIYFSDNATNNVDDDYFVVTPPVSNEDKWADGVPLKLIDADGDEIAVKDAAGNVVVNGWLINHEDFLRAQNVIDSVKNGETDLLDSVPFVDLRNAVLITLYRVKTQPSHATVKDPMNPSAPTTPALQFFSALQGAATGISDLGGGAGLSAAKRTNIVRAALSGLVNPDPRVRLTCIHWLRRCNPDESMLDGVQEAWDIESVFYVDAEEDPHRLERGHHEFVDTAADVQSKEAREELRKLYRFIVRRQLINLIISGTGKNVLAEIPRSKFITLTDIIDNEDSTRIPFYINPDTLPEDALIRPSMISIIVKGVNNPNFLNQKETVEFLIEYYNSYVVYDQSEWDVDEAQTMLSPAIRNQIINAIMEAKKDDVVIFEHEALLTGERDPQGRAVLLMVDPQTNLNNPLAMAITYKSQWDNAIAIRKTFGPIVQPQD